MVKSMNSFGHETNKNTTMYCIRVGKELDVLSSCSSVESNKNNMLYVSGQRKASIGE